MSFKPSPSRAGFFEKQKKPSSLESLHFRKNKKSRAEPTCPIFHFEKTKNNETADISDIFYESINASFEPKTMENNVNGFSYGKNGVSYRETMLTVSPMENSLSSFESFPIFHFRKNKKAEPNRADIFEQQKKSSRAGIFEKKAEPSTSLTNQAASKCPALQRKPETKHCRRGPAQANKK